MTQSFVLYQSFPSEMLTLLLMTTEQTKKQFYPCDGYCLCGLIKYKYKHISRHFQCFVERWAEKANSYGEKYYNNYLHGI